MKKYYLILILLFSGIRLLFSQVNSSGVPSIGMPIYTFKEGNISVPISINYDASGIRPTEVPSWVGQNWQLQAGANIRRIVRDKIDETGI